MSCDERKVISLCNQANNLRLLFDVYELIILGVDLIEKEV